MAEQDMSTAEARESYYKLCWETATARVRELMAQRDDLHIRNDELVEQRRAVNERNEHLINDIEHERNCRRRAESLIGKLQLIVFEVTEGCSNGCKDNFRLAATELMATITKPVKISANEFKGPPTTHWEGDRLFCERCDEYAEFCGHGTGNGNVLPDAPAQAEGNSQ
jgi:hypothetical protein